MIEIVRNERKWNHIKYSIKTTKDRKKLWKVKMEQRTKAPNRKL